MRAAVLRELGATPRVEDFAEPEPREGQIVLDVLAAGLNPVDIATASGTFYGGFPDVPCVVGREGIGRTGDGARVYFGSAAAPFGSFAERVPVEADSLFEVPEGVEDALAVAFGIAGLAAWLSLEHRAGLQEGETVLVLGASGVVGQVAVQAARLLGAAHVVAAARSAKGLERARELGATATVRLDEAGDLAQALRDAAIGGVDVVVDPLWGAPGVAALEAAAGGARVVQLGQSAGAEAIVRSAVVRGTPLSIIGHTNFAVSIGVRRAAYTRMVGHAAAGELTADVETVPLDRAAEAWERQKKGPKTKLVVVP